MLCIFFFQTKPSGCKLKPSPIVVFGSGRRAGLLMHMPSPSIHRLINGTCMLILMQLYERIKGWGAAAANP